MPTNREIAEKCIEAVLIQLQMSQIGDARFKEWKATLMSIVKSALDKAVAAEREKAKELRASVNMLVVSLDAIEQNLEDSSGVNWTLVKGVEDSALKSVAAYDTATRDTEGKE